MLEDSSPGGTPCPIRVAPEPPCAPCARTTHSHTEQRVRGDWTQRRVLSTPRGPAWKQGPAVHGRQTRSLS